MEMLKRIIGIILVAAVVTALVVLGVSFVKTRLSSSKSGAIGPQASSVPSGSQATEVNTQTLPSTGISAKSINSLGNQFSVPGSWGVLTCANSANFEFDPGVSNDSRVVCDIAQKPITILVNSQAACRGQSGLINGVSVTKYRVENARGVDYQWCFAKNGVSYNITHRVSASGVRGTSAEDYSAKIEEMIGSVK